MNPVDRPLLDIGLTRLEFLRISGKGLAGLTIAPAPVRVRFIPAGAGNTQRQDAQMEQQPVYPRWRGEHTKHT